MEEELKVPFSAPLNKLDTEAQTYGCRANNSDFWANNFIQDVCVDEFSLNLIVFQDFEVLFQPHLFSSDHMVHLA